MSDEQWRSRLTILLSLAVVVWLTEQIVPVLQTFSDAIMLFFLAWLVAFVLEPLVNVLARLHIGRTRAVLFIYAGLLVGLILLIVLLGPPVADQLGRLPDALPALQARLPPEAEVTRLLARFGLPASDVSAFYRPEILMQRIQDSAGALAQATLNIATSALTVIANTFLLLIISFYLLLDGRQIVRGSMRVLGREQRAPFLMFLSQLSLNFGGFLRGQVIQSGAFGAIVALVMIAFGLEFVAVTAVSSAVLMLIPIIGPFLALAPPLIVAIIQPSQYVLPVAIVLGVIQVFLVNALMPRVMSHQIGMPPLLVFVAILAGLRIGGVLGAFFGIPIMGVAFGMATAIFKSRKNGAEGEQSEA